MKETISDSEWMFLLDSVLYSKILDGGLESLTSELCNLNNRKLMGKCATIMRTDILKWKMGIYHY